MNATIQRILQPVCAAFRRKNPEKLKTAVPKKRIKE
jgi:hypothetical protein